MQGGTFLNDAVAQGFRKENGCRGDPPGFGRGDGRLLIALYAQERARKKAHNHKKQLDEFTHGFRPYTADLHEQLPADR